MSKTILKFGVKGNLGVKTSTNTLVNSVSIKILRKIFEFFGLLEYCITTKNKFLDELCFNLSKGSLKFSLHSNFPPPRLKFKEF